MGLLMLCSFHSISFAQFSIQKNYSLSRPMGHMGKVASNMFGVNLGLHYQFRNTPLSIGLEGGFGFYNFHRMEGLTLQYMNRLPLQGTYDLSMHSTSSYYFLVPRVYLNNKGMVKTYLNARIGRMRYATHFILQDSEAAMDETHDECPATPIDDGTVLKGGTWVAGIGLGTRLDIVEGFFSISLEVNYLRGGITPQLSLGGQPSAQTPQNDGIPGFASGITPLIMNILPDKYIRLQYECLTSGWAWFLRFLQIR